MSTRIGDRIPPPLAFDFKKAVVVGEPAQAVLLATVDGSGAPRIAVLAGRNIDVENDRTMRIALHHGSASATNAAARPACTLWCVLDGAAYAIQATAKSDGEPDEGGARFVLTVTGVFRDFEPGAPMSAGPTYKRLEG